jgi:Domain of unknown function (DUF5110)
LKSKEETKVRIGAMRFLCFCGAVVMASTPAWSAGEGGVTGVNTDTSGFFGSRSAGGARATIPFAWSNDSKTLTIGQRKGDFPGMLRERTFNIVFVRDCHGSGVDPTDKPDQIVKYGGEAVRVKPGG